MLVNAYTKSFVRPPNPMAQHLRCFASLDVDLTEVLPYLNTALKGHQYFKEPPSLTLKYQAKLITLYPRMIAINIVKDEDEAGDILEWLKREINDIWERRGEIEPSFEIAPRPRVFDILKLLPKTNCRKCGEPTCMVFAVSLSNGEKNPEQCPSVDQQNHAKLQKYLSSFRF